jgi:hypothetical protein
MRLASFVTCSPDDNGAASQTDGKSMFTHPCPHTHVCVAPQNQYRYSVARQSFPDASSLLPHLRAQCAPCQRLGPSPGLLSLTVNELFYQVCPRWMNALAGKPVPPPRQQAGNGFEWDFSDTDDVDQYAEALKSLDGPSSFARARGFIQCARRVLQDCITQ